MTGTIYFQWNITSLKHFIHAKSYRLSQMVLCNYGCACNYVLLIIFYWPRNGMVKLVIRMVEWGLIMGPLGPVGLRNYLEWSYIFGNHQRFSETYSSLLSYLRPQNTLTAAGSL